jgi:hypothetical protein
MFYAIRPCARTRASSPRQLPTDHDCAVPTRGYQSDQPSHLLLPASRAASCLHAPGNPLTSISRSRLLHLYLTLDKSLHIRTSSAKPTARFLIERIVSCHSGRKKSVSFYGNYVRLPHRNRLIVSRLSPFGKVTLFRASYIARSRAIKHSIASNACECGKGLIPGSQNP